MKYVLLGALLLVVLLSTTTISAQPAYCMALVDGQTIASASQELRSYASQLQSDEVYGASMGHIMQLLDLAERLDNARCGVFSESIYATK